MITEAITQNLQRLVVISGVAAIAISFVGLVLKIIWIKYEPEIENRMFKLLKCIGLKPKTTPLIEQQEVASVKFLSNTGEVLLILGTEQFTIKNKVDFNKPPEMLISYLMENQNRVVTKQELQDNVGFPKSADPSKLVGRLGFKGKRRELFFNVSDDSIRLNNPIYYGDTDMCLTIKELREELRNT